MINLLPYESKKQIRAARLNTILTVYLVIMILAAGFLALACNTTLGIINGSSDDGSAKRDQSELLIIKRDLDIAKMIFNRNISYSQTMSQLSETLPSETTMNNITIFSDPAGGPASATLSVLAKNDKIDTTLQSNIKNIPRFNNVILGNTVNLDTQDKTYSSSITLTMNIIPGGQ